MTDLAKSAFVADALMAEIRRAFPDDEQAIALDTMPLINVLRNKVSQPDLSGLLRVVDTGTDPSAGLAVSLLRAWITVPVVRETVERRWSSASPYLKNRLLWRLLDVPDLDPSWRATFERFVIDEWETFARFNRVFFGPPHEALGRLVQRLADASFPRSKKWAYLCCAPAVLDDPRDSASVIQLGLAACDGMNDELSTFLLTPPARPDVSTERTAPDDVLRYVADAVVARLRAGARPDDEECDLLDRLPLVDALRGRIVPTDLDWIWPVAESESGPRCGLFLSLVRTLSHRPDVQDRLRRRWHDTDSGFVRMHLVWRLLDDPALPDAWHRMMFDAVLEDWALFADVCRRFLGDDPQMLAPRALARVSDAAFPESKRWIQLCRVLALSTDRDAARALIAVHAQSRDVFTGDVARTLLDRFGQLAAA
jgi:hypothetical protein